MPKTAGSPTNNKVLRSSRIPKTVPKKLLSPTARQMSPMDDASPSLSVPRKANTRRNTMAATNGDYQKLVRRSARVIAKKTEWECEDMPPPSPAPPKRTMSVKKSTAKKSVRKTLVCGDDGESFNGNHLPSKATRTNYVRLINEPEHRSSDDEERVENAVVEKSVDSKPNKALDGESTVHTKNGTFDISNENVNDVSDNNVITEDEQQKENLPSVSLLGAKLKSSKIQSSDSETENLPSVSTLGASDSDSDNLIWSSTKPKSKEPAKIAISESAHKKTPSARKILVCGDGEVMTNDVSIAQQSSDDQSDVDANKTSPKETLTVPAQELNESGGEKKNGTFEIPKENENNVSGMHLLTEDESDGEEKQKHALPSISMLGVVKPTEIGLPEIMTSDSEHDASPSVSKLVTTNTRISIVDLTDSPVVKMKTNSNPNSESPIAESPATESVNDKTFSPVESTGPPKLNQSPLLKLPSATPNASSKKIKNPRPFKVHTPFKRKSPRTSTGASKKPLTSAKKKCLLSMAKQAIAERTSSKQVAFNSPAKDRTRTPNRGLSMGVKKTPYRLPTEGATNATNENEEPTASTSGPKTPGKMPDFSKMHQKLFANMESLDSALVRVDERSKELMSGKKVPAVAKIVKPVISGGIGARRALQPPQSTTRFGVGGGTGGIQGSVGKLHKVTKTINREDRRKQMFKPMTKNNDSTTGRVARTGYLTGILKGVRTNRRFDLMMQSRDLANNH